MRAVCTIIFLIFASCNQQPVPIKEGRPRPREENTVGAGFSPDGKLLFTSYMGLRTGEAWKLWQLPTGKRLPLPPHLSGLGPVGFLRDGRLILATTEGVLQIWN